ncbi:MAG TPA: hypothetical protein VF212_14865 [Longimicrobiales bacterium]
MRRADGRTGVGATWVFALAAAVALSACDNTPADPTVEMQPAVLMSGGEQPSGDKTPMFDFSDAFYAQNGVDPSELIIRVGTAARPQTAWTIDDSGSDPTRNDVRILETNGGYDNSGHRVFFTINAVLTADAFTSPAAKATADAFRVFIFPREQPDGTFNLTVAPQDRRQDNVFDTRNGYFSNDPLQLWVIDFVMWTDAAFNTPEGQARLAQLAAENGLSADGTPIIRSASTVDSLAAEGFVELIERAEDGSEGFQYVVCSIYKDPRDGAITDDAFLVLVPRADGTDVDPMLRADFESLQTTGDFAED